LLNVRLDENILGGHRGREKIEQVLHGSCVSRAGDEGRCKRCGRRSAHAKGAIAYFIMMRLLDGRNLHKQFAAFALVDTSNRRLVQRLRWNAIEEKEYDESKEVESVFSFLRLPDDPLVSCLNAIHDTIAGNAAFPNPPVDLAFKTADTKRFNQSTILCPLRLLRRRARRFAVRVLSHAASRLPYCLRFRIGFTSGYLSMSKWFSGICLTKIWATVSA